MPFTSLNRAEALNEVLIWVEAKEADTGAPAFAGVWTGAWDQEFVVGAELRRYIGIGRSLQLPAHTARGDSAIQHYTITLPYADDKLRNLLKGYNLDQVPAQVHVAVFDPVSNQLEAIDLVFDGRVNKLTFRRAAKGREGASVEMELAPWSRLMTKASTAMVSHQSIRQRSVNGTPDAIARHIDASGIVQTPWGSSRA